MDIKPIKTEDDYRKALKRLEEIFDASIGTKEGDEADIFGQMVDEYEKKHYPMDDYDHAE
jgi:HTH-type transcriptional regulator / antitoxin HigA